MKLPRFEPFLSYRDNVLCWAFQREDYPDIPVDAVLENLNSLEKYIFEQYAKEHRSQKSIADELNRSTENTRQHLVKAFRKIRHAAELIDTKMKLQMALENYSYDPDDPNFIMLQESKNNRTIGEVYQGMSNGQKFFVFACMHYAMTGIMVMSSLRIGLKEYYDTFTEEEKIVACYLVGEASNKKRTIADWIYKLNQIKPRRETNDSISNL